MAAGGVSGREIRVARLGVIHPRRSCAFCGQSKAPMYKTVLYATRAWGWVCEDFIACLRRRGERRAA
jgi:hypothetical protein